MISRIPVGVCVSCFLLLVCFSSRVQSEDNGEARKILAHYMPWYEAKPTHAAWGWHWTMGQFDPDRVVDGKREIASHFHPLIGPYDSSDAAVLEYHLLTMKMAGIDGVVIDWYGLTDFRDYATLHRNTERLIEQAKKLGMLFVICYEDQTIPALVQARKIGMNEVVEHAVTELKWMRKNWFSLDNYLSSNGRPVLLSFGQSGLNDSQWSECLDKLGSAVEYYSLHHRRTAAIGAFDWPIPSQGIAAIDRFRKDSGVWPASIPVAFPRFVDIYSEAKVGPSYGRIEDASGNTFKETLAAAMNSSANMIQLATWNDWGEGTIIEPSVEYGYRDLEIVQQFRKKYLQPNFTNSPAHLRLPFALFRMRQHGSEPETGLADKIARALAEGSFDEAEKLLGR